MPPASALGRSPLRGRASRWNTTHKTSSQSTLLKFLNLESIFHYHCHFFPSSVTDSNHRPQPPTYGQEVMNIILTFTIVIKIIHGIICERTVFSEKNLSSCPAKLHGHEERGVVGFCWLLFFFFFFFFAFPSYISGVHHFWVRFLRM